jgi:redox-sensitive bicupin YhaK (pirin superfamily)
MSEPIKAILSPRESDIGNLVVRRFLPQRAARLVGPFIFFDHMGPAIFAPGKGLDVKPHPHIGLATVTYLFEGAITHRDSLGSRQDILPGDINWMTAGTGIVHSERTPDAARATGHVVNGIQTWVALPVEHEDAAPTFSHHPAASLPTFERDGVRVRVLVGTISGIASPVETFSSTLFTAAEFGAGGVLVVDNEHEERAAYLIDGDLAINRYALQASTMVVLTPGAEVRLESAHGARVMLLGGAHLPGERYIEWNFVSSSRKKIEVAKSAWTEQTFPKVPGETEWTPLPVRERR